MPRSTTPPIAKRLSWVTVMVALVGLTAAFSIAGLIVQPPAAKAAPIAVDQCNNVGPGPGGATTGMTCTVTVVNTIASGITSSTTTVTRQCSLDPCPPGNGTFVSSSTDLVTAVNQCNGSDNDAAHPITCDVIITNNVSADTPGAQPVTAATINQCVGSGGGGGGIVNCTPFPATTTSATVTQCNGSANGGQSTAACSVAPASAVTPAILLSVNQCNGTGNSGGLATVLTCRTRITTNIIAAVSPTGAAVVPVPTPTVGATVAPTPGATVAPTPGATVAPTTSATVAPTPGATVSPTSTITSAAGSPVQTPTSTSTSTSAPGLAEGSPQVPRVPTGGVPTGTGSPADGHRLLTFGVALLLTGAASAMLRRRATRRG